MRDIPWNDGSGAVPTGCAQAAVKVDRYLGIRAVQRIQHPGAVAIDPAPHAPAVFFLVRPSCLSTWLLEHTIALNADDDFVLPPASRQRPPGPYWLLPPYGRLYTPADELRAALERAAGSTPCGARP